VVLTLECRPLESKSALRKRGSVKVASLLGSASIRWIREFRGMAAELS
jgi:hypothetical protein